MRSVEDRIRLRREFWHLKKRMFIRRCAVPGCNREILITEKAVRQSAHYCPWHQIHDQETAYRYGYQDGRAGILAKAERRALRMVGAALESYWRGWDYGYEVREAYREKVLGRLP